MQTFSFNPLISIFEEETWLLAVTRFEATNFVQNITDEKNTFLN